MVVKAKMPSGATALNTNDPRIKQDILQMIVQYLQDEGFSASVMTVQDEANVKLVDQQNQRAQLKRVRSAIMEGDWTEVEKISSKAIGQHQKSFLYSVYRQQHMF